MRKQTVGAALLALLLCTPGLTLAEGEGAHGSMGVDINSAYVFRGATVHDKFVAQPYMEISELPAAPGLTVGTWANFNLEDNSAGTADSGDFNEVDIYASYSLPLGMEKTDISLGYTEYVYVGGEADREGNIVVSMDTALSPTLGVYYGFDGAIDEAVYIELGAGSDIELTQDLGLSLGGVLGYAVQPDADADTDGHLHTADDGISHLTLSASLNYSFLSASANYVIETDEDVLYVDEEFWFGLGLKHEF